MGDANASIPTPQPVIMKPMFGALGKARANTCITFVSKAAYEKGIKSELGLEKIVLPVSNCRSVGKKDMILNNTVPKIEIDPKPAKSQQMESKLLLNQWTNCHCPALLHVLIGVYMK